MFNLTAMLTHDRSVNVGAAGIKTLRRSQPTGAARFCALFIELAVSSYFAAWYKSGWRRTPGDRYWR